LAVLEGALANYGAVNVAGLRPNHLGAGSSELFRSVIEDATYQELAAVSYDLGFSQRVKAAAARTRELARRLTARPGIRQWLEYALQLVRTKLGDPPIALPRFLVGAEEYFPPLVEYEGVRKRSVDIWLRRSPRAIPHPSDGLSDHVVDWLPAGGVEPAYSSRGRIDDPEDL
jgi:hypothetical protein